ncbi:hypothetical protein [Legionella fallonii]|uniref:Uncharacterized protein n=1 Tax=Legionella fallonii LLAP-10 TaxID=1212491 RepID=A0A098G7C8_9GAMM|nr:hypothetical protein [Legionella fallonii]CEG58362.1 protein of unknown function [Legionella fallonii LLAP-10]
MLRTSFLSNSITTYIYVCRRKITKNDFEKIKDDLIKSFELQLDSKQRYCPIDVNNSLFEENEQNILNNLFNYKPLEKTIKKYGLFNQPGFKDITIICEPENENSNLKNSNR